MRYSKSFLTKIEDFFGYLGYTIRYEKGNFQSGYCIVEDRKIAVINKFFDTEARINSLVEILGTINLDLYELTDEHHSLIKEVQKKQAVN